MKKHFLRLAERMSQSVGLMAVAALLAAGCATTEKDQFSPLPADLVAAPVAGGVVGETNTIPGGLAAVVQDKGDRFAVGDLVTVKFSGTSGEIPSHEERIKSDGTITLPLIGAVQAAGKSPGELQKEIYDCYVPTFYKRLTVVVSGEQRVYSVGGQVRSPGRQAYIGATTVTKAIQSAGDFTDFAAKNDVQLTRADGKTITVDCVKAAKDPSLDPAVYPGDKINVPLRDWRYIFRP